MSIALIAASLLLAATLTTPEAEILQLENKRVQAVIGRDFATLDALMDPDCVFVESDGTTRTTAEFIANLRSQRTTFATFVTEESHVRFFGDAAIVTGRYRNALREDGKVLPTKIARFTRVWAQQAGGGWRMVSHQATAISAATR